MVAKQAADAAVQRFTFVVGKHHCETTELMFLLQPTIQQTGIQMTHACVLCKVCSEGINMEGRDRSVNTALYKLEAQCNISQDTTHVMLNYL